jgi:hypothetical protein
MMEFSVPVSKSAPSKELLGGRGRESAITVGIDEGHFFQGLEQRRVYESRTSTLIFVRLGKILNLFHIF